MDEVRPLLHKGGVGSGVVAPVESGTVLVPRDRMGLSVAAQWVYRLVRRLGKAAVIIGWNDRASIVYPITGAVSAGWGWGGEKEGVRLTADLGGMGALKRAGLSLATAMSGSPGSERRQAKAAERIATATGADTATVLRYVRQYEQRLAPDLLLAAIGKPDVATLVRLADAGRFDQWRTGRSMLAEWRRSYLPILLLLLALTVVMTYTAELLAMLDPTVKYVLVPALVLLVMLITWRRARYRTARMPVDEVLPVVQVPDEWSDSQSAR
nr:hypothetical protein [Kibdelosporangium sp. MJ126-NF4]CTQ93994.1 hypothetical protein [Kibdelosporangium sp. MJ126-NF4]